MHWKGLENNHNRLLKPSLNKSVNQGNKFNSAIPENGNDPDKIASSKYHVIDEMQNIKIPQ